ncbi:MAG: aspartate kinase, partial [Pseudomonadota bacterium]
MKFGGTSVADMTRIRAAATRVTGEVAAGHDVIVVVSAMAGETNRLVGLVEDAARGETANHAGLYDTREYDAVVASGEQVTAGLMALALQEQGVPARSWQGWQLPIHTSAVHGAARIERIETGRIDAKFGEGLHAVVSGFQGLGP